MTARPEPASLAAAAGGLALLVSLFLDWYAPGISAFTAFEALDLMLAALALAALAPGAAALAGSLGAGALDLSLLDRYLPVVAGLALLIVVSQALNHPPAAVGEDALAGQWIALVAAAVIAGAAALASRGPTALASRGPAAGSGRRVTPAQRAAATGDGARSRRQPAGARPPARAATAPAEARAAEPEVMGELYPDVERTGPIGGDDPEVARGEPRGARPLGGGRSPEEPSPHQPADGEPPSGEPPRSRP